MYFNYCDQAAITADKHMEMKLQKERNIYIFLRNCHNDEQKKAEKGRVDKMMPNPLIVIIISAMLCFYCI